MQVNYKYVAAGVAAVLLLGFLWALTPEQTPGEDNWSGMVNTAEKQKVAGDFALQYESAGVINEDKLIDAKQISQKVSNKDTSKEDAILTQLNKGLTQYISESKSILRGLSNKTLYQAYLYSGQSEGAHRLQEIEKENNRILHSLSMIVKELPYYQVAKNEPLFDKYSNIIFRANNLYQYTLQIQNFITEIQKLKTQPDECLQFINQSHPNLVTSYRNLQ